MPSYFINRGIIAVSAVDVNSETGLWVAAVGAVGATQRGRIDSLITALKGHSLFSANSALWLHAGANQDGNPTEALVDIMGLRVAVISGHAPTLGDGGFTGNGTSQYIDYGSQPSNYAQTSGSYGGYARTSSTTSNAQVLLGSQTTGSGVFSDLLPLLGTTAIARDHVQGSMATTTNSNRQGFYIVTTPSDGVQALYKNGSAFDSGSLITFANTVGFYGLARNDSGSASSFNGTDELAAAWIGPGLDATQASNLTTDIEAYMDAWGVGVI